MNRTLFPNQIDDGYVNQIDALLTIENILGTNPNGSEFSTISDRFNYIEKTLDTLKLSLNNLNLSNVLSINNCTNGYDIVLSTGDAITGADGIVNIIGNTIITGELNISNDIELNNNYLKNLKYPVEPNDASTKSYTDDQLNVLNNNLTNKIYEIINNKNCSIQYSVENTQPIPKTEANKYLKRNIDNTNWEFIDLDIDKINNKIESVIKSIGFITKNITNGEDLKISIGDAIRGEDDYVNIDSHVIIHKSLLMHNNIDLQSNRITGSLPPIFKSDLVNKQYVDTKLPTNLAIENQKTGSILYFNGESWIPLLPGKEGEVLIIKNDKPFWGELKFNG